MQEREAVERLRRGDIGGLEALVREHYVEAVRAAYLVTRDRALAEDVAQDAFVRAYERIGGFDPARPFRPWFLRSVVNAALNAARQRRGRHATAGGEASPLHRLADPGAGPEELAERAGLREAVWRALGELPPPQRAAIVLRYYAGMGEAEIAAEQGCPPGTVKWRLHAARERLRALLSPVRREW
jgi:RNA polymerase sigma-70 factor (ECF subfamily)